MLYYYVCVISGRRDVRRTTTAEMKGRVSWTANEVYEVYEAYEVYPGGNPELESRSARTIGCTTHVVVIMICDIYNNRLGAY